MPHGSLCASLITAAVPHRPTMGPFHTKSRGMKFPPKNSQVECIQLAPHSPFRWCPARVHWCKMAAVYHPGGCCTISSLPWSVELSEVLDNRDPTRTFITPAGFKDTFPRSPAAKRLSGPRKRSVPCGACAGLQDVGTRRAEEEGAGDPGRYAAVLCSGPAQIGCSRATGSRKRPAGREGGPTGL